MSKSAHTSDPITRALNQEQLPESYFTWPGVLDRLGRREELSESQVHWAMREIMDGKAGEATIAAFSFGLRVKGISAAELAAAAETMRSFAAKVDFSDQPKCVDIVGTGGDGHHTVNISTMASIVIAAAGIPVVKHGNRAASSKCGGADMLEALGVDIERDPEGIREDAAKTNFAFMYSKTYHPAMRFAAPVRSELAVPTLFNLLGPMTNPATPRYGLIGCAFRDMMPIMGGAFAHQGARVLVVRGMDGMDEISVCAPTEVVTVDETGLTSEATINPAALGLNYHEEGALTGGDAAYNAQVAIDLFNGELEGAIKDAVLINAAGALTAVRGWTDRITPENGYSTHEAIREVMKEELQIAREALESGAAKQTLQRILGKSVN